MPEPLALHVRRQIFSRWQQGRLPADIAFELRLTPRTVRHLCQRFREHGKGALDPAYHRPTTATVSATIKKAMQLRERHPSWGAAYILLQMEQRYPDLMDLPSERTLLRHIRAAQQPAAPPGRKPPASRQSATRPHEVWQMDAVEQCPLKTGKKNLLVALG